MSKNVRVARTTAANAAIAYTLNPTIAWQLECVKIHLSAVGGAGTLTITQDANAGSTYDTLILSQDMTAATDIIWLPDSLPIPMVAGDKIVIAYANINNRAYGIEIFWSAL